MNKIYRVIWSKTKNCYVVASELAKRHTKSPQSEVVNKIAALTLVGALSFGFAGSAWAAIPEGTARGDGAIAVGDLSVANGVYSLAVGAGAETGFYDNTDPVNIIDVKASHAAAVGPHASAQAMYSSVFGAYSGVTVNPEITIDLTDNKKDRVLQGFGATVLGSLNSSSTSATDNGQKYASVANSIVGVANIATDSNGALIYGAGNAVTNSYQDVIFDGNETEIQKLVELYDEAVNEGDRTKMAQVAEKLRGMVKVSGGQVMAFGGQNTADYAYRAQIIGVGNELTGSATGEITIGDFTYKKYDTEYDLLDGFENKVGNSSHVSVIGTGNNVQQSDNNVIVGDYHGLNGGGNNVIIGSYIPTVDENSSIGFKATQHKSNIEETVMLGYKTDVRYNKGVALGANSLGNTDAGVPGYDPLSSSASKQTHNVWKATAAAVSVGNELERTWYGFNTRQLQSAISTYRTQLNALGVNTSLGVQALLDSLNPTQMEILAGLVEHTDVVSETRPTKSGTTYGAKPGSGVTRQITNVAAGSKDTDAVNVAQLKSVETHYYSVNDNGKISGNYQNDGASGRYGVAAGVNAASQGMLSTVMGASSKTADPLAEILVASRTRSSSTKPSDSNAVTLLGQINPILQSMPSINSAGSTVLGSLNSIGLREEYATKSGEFLDAIKTRGGSRITETAFGFLESVDVSDGISNTIVGNMNETNYSNVALIYGTGNSIKNSYEEFVPGFDDVKNVIKDVDVADLVSRLNSSNPFTQGFAAIEAGLLLNDIKNSVNNIENVAELQQAIETNNFDKMKEILSGYIDNEEGGKGGRSIAIGTNNKIDYGTLSRLTGTNNKLTGTEDAPASFTILDGYKNTAYSTSYATVLGNENTIGAEGTTTENTIVLGDNNTITAGSNNNIVLGTVTNAVGAAEKGNIVSVGYNTTLNAANSIGVGTDNIVTGENSIAIGKGHTVSGANSGAFGDPSTIASANSYSVGNNNTIAEDYENVFALGNNITTVTSNSVFLGDSAAYVAKGDSTGGLDAVTKATVNGFTFGTFAGATPGGVVSVGAVGEKTQRRIQNVAAGLISAKSTDAINGSQLYAAIDGMQFDIKAGDNITVATETIDGIKTYTISSSNATAVKPGKNVAVEGPTETNGAAGTPTGGDTNASVDQGTYKTDNYTVNAADSKVTGFTLEAGKPTTSGITTTTDYTVTLTSDEQSVVDGIIKSETVDRSVTFTVTDTNTTYTIKADPGEDGSNIVNTYTVTGSDGKDLDPIVDTDTQYELSGEKGETNDNQTTPYTISLKGTDGSENTFKLMDTRNTVEAGDDTIVVESTENEDGSFKYTITSKAKSVSNVEVKAGSDNVIVTSDGDEEKKVYTVDVKTDGEVASGNTGIVTGDTVYKETRVEKDGNYIKKDNTAADNLVALDEKVKDNSTRIDNINNQFGDMDNRMRKGLAGAAALAALHPMDFNPDDKMQFSAGVGHYRGETAAAIGAFYRPDESVMFSIGGTFGNSDNMINAGITFGLDGTRNRITRSRTAMAREIQDLRSLVTQMAARMDRLEGANVETAMFPDVPENHWAYEYVEDLQKRGALKGYPDGLFKGDRAMTRYEFAAMLDRLVRSGVMLDSKIAKEFEPELGRIYVERISGQDNDRKKVERVRVNNSDSKYPEGKTRDVYGSKIVTEVPKAAEAK